MSSTDIQRKIAFSQIKGLKLEQGHELIERMGGVDDFFDLSTRKLWDKIGSQKSYCTDASRDALLEIGKREKEFADKNNIDAIFFSDESYPKRLLECSDAPAMLYKLGKCDLNASHIVSIVGTRKATAYGQKLTNDLVAGLAERLDSLVIVSGLAYGIDVAAHKAALQAGVPTVGVVAHGLKTLYPAEHRDIAARMIKNGGALVTEYTSDAPIHRGNFLARNRIVAGMADATVIVESEEKGGAMVTASIAVAYGRDVCAVPGRCTDRFSAGPLKLISTNRAALIRNADDLIALMNWKAKPSAASAPELDFKKSIDSLGTDQRKIVDYLRMKQKATVNEMVADLEIPYALLSARLMELEMDDFVNALPGSAYSINI